MSLPEAAWELLDLMNVTVVTVRYVHKDNPKMEPQFGHLAVFPTDFSYHQYLEGVEEGVNPVWGYIDSKFMYEVAGFRGETVADLTTLERNGSDFIVVDIME
jgi:hypothetical protein